MCASVRITWYWITCKAHNFMEALWKHIDLALDKLHGTKATA